MPIENTDTLIVSGGQAGIALSEHLGNNNVPHIILEGSVYKSYGFMVCSFQIRGINDHGLQAVSGMALGD